MNIEFPENTIFHDVLEENDTGSSCRLIVCNPPTVRTIVHLNDCYGLAYKRLYFPYQYVAMPYHYNKSTVTFFRLRTYTFYSPDKLDHSSLKSFTDSEVHDLPLWNYYNSGVHCLGRLNRHASSLIKLYTDYMDKFWLSAYEGFNHQGWVEATKNNIGNEWLKEYLVNKHQYKYKVSSVFHRMETE